MKTTLLLTFVLFLTIAGGTNSVFALQKNSEEVLSANALKTSAQEISGTITEIVISTGFSYVELNTSTGKVWVARPGSTSLKIGDETAFTTEMKMKNFHSKSLQRDFSVIYFIKKFSTEKSPPAMAKQSRTALREVQVGEHLIEMKLDGLNGDNKTFSDFKGKPLIINVWASWCGPCREEMGALKNLAQRYNGKQFNLIGISTDDYRNRAEAFIKLTDIKFENFLDHNLRMEKMLGASRLPLTVFVDEEGKVLAKVRGSREWDKPEIIDAIGEVLHVELNH